jgi:5-hydroxyisourate hydrolase-like protein (transthyretin family)
VRPDEGPAWAFPFGAGWVRVSLRPLAGRRNVTPIATAPFNPATMEGSPSPVCATVPELPVRRALVTAVAVVGSLLFLALLPVTASAQAVLVGTVTDAESGAPIAGAEVSLESWDGQPVASVRTDAEGRYRIQRPGEAIYIATAGSPGHLRSEFARIELSPGEETVQNFVLKPHAAPAPTRPVLAPLTAGAGEIAGRVLDRTTGTPITGAVVTLESTAGDTIASSTSRPGGEFRLRVPRTGGYRITARLGEFARSEAILVDGSVERGTTLDVELISDPVVLDGISAEGSRDIHWWHEQRPVWTWPYYERRYFYGRLNIGRFYDGEYLEEWDGVNAVDFARSHAPYARCRALVVVDGWEIGHLDLFGGPARGGADDAAYDALAIADSGDLEGMEIFRGQSEMPPEWFGECMVISIWQRRGGR